MALPKGNNSTLWGGADDAAKQALSLAQSNESDIDALDHIVHAIATDKTTPPTLNPASMTSIGGVKVDGTTIVATAAGVISAVSQAARLLKMTGIVPTTLAGLRVSHLRKDFDGTLPEGTIDLTNGGTTDLTIKAGTAFVTGLTLAKVAKSYDALDFATGAAYTLSVNNTGASMAFTTDITIKANTTMTFYVRAND